MGHDPPQQHGRAIDHAAPGGHVLSGQPRDTDVGQRTQHSTQPLPSPAMSANSGTLSDPVSSASSGRPPRLISDEGSSSSPSSAAFQTPDNTPNIDPFSSLSITAITEADGLAPLGEDPTARHDSSTATSATNPPPRSVPPDRSQLTSESLRPLNEHMSGPRGSTASTPSVASSSRSEKRDQLAPLRSQRPTPVERPSMTRAQSSAARPSPPPPRSTAPSRIPMPSPPAMGLSELMTGGSPIATPNNEQGYFAGANYGTPSLSRSNSNPASRRTPQYSPFRSYYGPTAEQVHAQSSADQSRRLETRRTSQLGPEQLDTPTHIRAASTTAVSLTAMAADVTGATPQPASEGSRGSAGSGPTGPSRSPRIQNTGGVLAPHGSFTTARAPKKKKERPPKMAPASDSQLYVGSMRKMGLSEAALAAQAEHDALEQAARTGDQLAMYRLGWVAEMSRGQRYQIGSIEDVWGSASPASNETQRSSFSSRGSIVSTSSTGRERSGSRQGTPTSDLFQDAAGLALRDTAGRNGSGSYVDRPPSVPAMSPRP